MNLLSFVAALFDTVSRFAQLPSGVVAVSIPNSWCLTLVSQPQLDGFGARSSYLGETTYTSWNIVLSSVCVETISHAIII